MNDEKIKVRVTASGQTLDVVVLNKRLDKIEIVLGEGESRVEGASVAGNALLLFGYAGSGKGTGESGGKRWRAIHAVELPR